MTMFFSEQQQKQQYSTQGTSKDEVDCSSPKTASSKTMRTVATLPSYNDISQPNLTDEPTMNLEQEPRDEDGAKRRPSLFPIHSIETLSVGESVASSINDDDDDDEEEERSMSFELLEKEMVNSAAIQRKRYTNLLRTNKQIKLKTERMEELKLLQFWKPQERYFEDITRLALLEEEIKTTRRERDELKSKMDRRGFLGNFGDLRQRAVEKELELTALTSEQKHLSKLIEIRDKHAEELKELREEMDILLEQRVTLEKDLEDHPAKNNGFFGSSCASMTTSSLVADNRSSVGSRTLRSSIASKTKNVCRNHQKKANSPFSFDKGERLQSRPAFTYTASCMKELHGSRDRKISSFAFADSNKKKQVVSSLLGF